MCWELACVLIANMLPSVSACICAEHLDGGRQLETAVSLMLINTAGTVNPFLHCDEIKWNKSLPSRKKDPVSAFCTHDSAVRTFAEAKWQAHMQLQWWLLIEQLSIFNTYSHKSDVRSHLLIGPRNDAAVTLRQDNVCVRPKINGRSYITMETLIPAACFLHLTACQWILWRFIFVSYPQSGGHQRQLVGWAEQR